MPGPDNTQQQPALAANDQTESVATSPDSFAVVGIGASAGGLQACQKLLDAMPDDLGMAFILVQHLDPTHPSLMAELLARHTRMQVQQATEGMLIAPDTLYAIPPGTYLSVSHGALHLSQPDAPHGARLPFDFLLRSLAEEYASRAVGVVLSGTGADGSIGVQSIRQHHGFVIAQKPEEAEYDGMPSAAIAAHVVDMVLPVAEIPEALIGYNDSLIGNPAALATPAAASLASDANLTEIIRLLRTTSAHDFTLYKPGTLRRRIERRIGMVGLPSGDTARYLEMLRRTPGELDLLAKDLLIHVTSFFRDPKVFELLAKSTLPALIKRHDADTPLRIWVAGCSTGEETYSLAILLKEQIAATGIALKLQIFASDIDPDAVTAAREGIYPASIEALVSAERLARFFTRELGGYRVTQELRGTVVCTVQDLLADPPFSRLDMISCRNVLIYLRPEAQAKVTSMFHFALRQDGILLLGSAETIGAHHAYFDTIDKSARLYRHIARSKPGEANFIIGQSDPLRIPTPLGPSSAQARQANLAETCRRLVLEAYAPAAILINAKQEVLYSLGPVDRYLRMATGQPTLNVLAMARPGMRSQLRQAIEEAGHQKTRAVSGGHVTQHGEVKSFNIEVHPVPSDKQNFLLLCFVDTRQSTATGALHPASGTESPRVSELEHELEVTRTDLHTAIRNLEISGEEQSAVNQEAQSVNEEFQSTNEELLASKEELQSLNEELTALNGQLQETLERQRATSNDLQNVLYSTDVATLFLDLKLCIRFFTPATRMLFNVIPGDIGRPLADLNSLAIDRTLSDDAHAIIAGMPAKDREIQMPNGTWFNRRMLPYRTHDNEVAGVVMTFTDVTERKHVAKALEVAKQEADIANHAKSRFLAAASHDLRQPLQTLALLQGVLAKTVEDAASKALVVRLDEALSGISGMLNALLDINEIETGSVNAEVVDFPLNTLLARMQQEFSFHAETQGLTLRVVACSLMVRSDPRLLEQMLRNLLSNAMKYTKTGKILLGCRRHHDMVSIEVWDTGVGIPDREQLAIFQEYHQLNNAARQRSRGLGLGLSIVQRLAEFLGHKVEVRSTPGKGSVFSIHIQIPLNAHQISAIPPPIIAADRRVPSAAVTVADILLIEDDASVRDLLSALLAGEGHSVTAVEDGVAALALIRDQAFSPALILTDYNLPNGMDGVDVTTRLREELRQRVPVIVLTGDISKDTLRKIAQHDCVQLNKPIKPTELSAVIQRLLPHVSPTHAAHPLPPIAIRPPTPESTLLRIKTPNLAASADRATVIVIDDDTDVRETIRIVLEIEGYAVQTHASAEEFLANDSPPSNGCLLIDEGLPGISGLELLRQLRAQKHHLPAIMITGHSNVPMAVEAMKFGAADFIDKPVSAEELLASVARALEQAKDSVKLTEWHDTASRHVASLTDRQRQIMDLVLAGHPSKNIAADLGISQRTVENHRASIMRKTHSKSLPALARLALAAQDNVV